MKLSFKAIIFYFFLAQALQAFEVIQVRFEKAGPKLDMLKQALEVHLNLPSELIHYKKNSKPCKLQKESLVEICIDEKANVNVLSIKKESQDLIETFL